MLLSVLKGLSLGAAIAVVWLWETGDWVLALAAVPMLLTMGYATRLRAKRRAREGVGS